MKNIQANISWYSDEYSDTPTFIKLQLSDADIDKIKLCQQLIKEHNLRSIRIDIDAELLQRNEQYEYIGSYWRADCMYLSIYSTEIYFYSQNRRDAGDQIQSEDLMNLIFKPEMVA